MVSSSNIPKKSNDCPEGSVPKRERRNKILTTPKDEETGREDKRFLGNFMGLALTFSLHNKAPQQQGWGFYRILSWQNTEFHDAQSTTNPPGLLLGMKNQLSHSRTNPNLKEKTCWDEAVPSTNPTPNLGGHKTKLGSPQPQIWGSTNLGNHKSSPWGP